MDSEDNKQNLNPDEDSESMSPPQTNDAAPPELAVEPTVPPEVQDNPESHVATEGDVSSAVKTEPLPVAPEPTSAVPPTPAVTTPAASAVEPDVLPAEPKKTRKWVKVLLIVGIPTLLLLGALFVVAFFNMDRIQSLGRATLFLGYVTEGNVDEAVKLTGDQSSRTFISASSQKLKGSEVRLSDYEYNSDKDSYYLFNLSGSNYKSARVVVGKEGGVKHAVKTFVYDVKALPLKPTGASSQ